MHSSAATGIALVAKVGKSDPRLTVCVVGSGTQFVSGISYYTYFLARSLKQRYEVVAILMRCLIPRRWYPGRQRVGESLMAFDVRTEVSTFDGVDWWGIPSLFKALSFFRATRPDVLVLQWWSASVLPWYLLLAMQAQSRGCAVVIELHEDVDSGEARLPLLGAVARRGLQALCGRASALVVHSGWDRERLSRSLGVPEERFAVITHAPYPIFDAVADDATMDAPSTSGLHEKHSVTILFFGTIRPYKGLEYLVPAFEQVREKSDLPYRLVVVGETWEGWTLPLRLIEDSRYCGDIELVNRYVTDREAARYFERADVVALPYLRSSASGPLAIAQAYGLPVVVTDVGGLKEAVAGYTGAVVVQPADSRDLARGILAAAGLRRRRHAAPLGWDRVAELYSDVIAAACQSAPRSI